MKKILFLNTTKLTSLSALVLLAVFCAVGMSFTPAEEGENVGDPNDSTYVTGPRRNHWTTSSTSCGTTTTTYHNKIDNGTVTATITGASGGTISVSGTTNSTSATTNNNTATVTVKWNCGYTSSDQNNTTGFASDLAARHTNKITFSASEIEGYSFKGWYEDDKGNTLAEGGASRTYTETFIINYGTSDGKTDATWNRYAIYTESKEVEITMPATVGGSYTYTCIDGNGTVTSSASATLTTENEVTLKATAASGYKFFGWYTLNGTTENYQSYESSFSKTFTENTTIYAKFVLADAALFQVKGETTTYYDLTVAANAAKSSSSKVVLPIGDGTVYGNHTIPSGVTLLIPYDANNTVEKSTPTSVAPAAASNCKPYRTLTLASGTTLTVNGEISVASKQFSTNTTYNQTGVRSYYGYLLLKENSKILLNSGAYLYAWGYVSGDGEIVAHDGSFVYEMFQIDDFRGGSATSGMLSGIFPFSQYYVQNIEASIKLEYGATEYVRSNLYVDSKQFPSEIKFIGKAGALFTMSSGYLIKKYERATDRMHYTLSGNFSLSKISLKFTYIFSITVNSSDYVLPLTSNMSIDVLSGSTFTMTENIAILPDVRINIESGAKIVINSNKSLYIYDLSEWSGKKFVYSAADLKQLPFVGRNHSNTYGSPYARTLAKDAMLNVDGEIEVSGTIYTTSSGADICSTGTGKVTLKSKAGTETTTQQATQSNTTITEVDVPITAAKLHNASTWYTAPYSGVGKECEYLATAGAAANTTIQYANGHWGWVEIWKDHDGTVLKAINTIAKSTSGTAPSNPSRTGYSFTGWSAASEDATKQEVTHTAQYDPIYSTVTFNANGHGTAPADITNVAYNTTITAPTAPTAAEWVFSGWYKEAACTNAWNFSTDKVTANTTLYAKWVAAVASVTPEGGSATYHATIADAFTTANTKTNPIVKILQDASTTSQITISAAMTIDLNDKTISATQASASGVFKIDASGKTVTIKDSGTKGKIDHTASYNGKLYGVWLTAGSLKIEGGKIYTQNNAAASNDYRAYGIWTDGSASSITMSDGTIEATSKNMAFGIYCGNTCAITMTGGEINSHGNTCIRGIYTQGTTKLTDATITSTATSTDCRTFYIKSGTDLTINSGTYTATGATGSIQVVYQQAGKVTINGGRFSATDVEFIKDAGTTNIKGGYYVHDTNLAANCATNYHVLPLTGEAPYNYKVAEAYTVTFKDGSTTLQSGYVEKNTTPVYSDGTPSKDPEYDYTYTFEGWSDGTNTYAKDATLPAVTGPATYTALFQDHLRYYTVTWKNWDGTILETDQDEEGGMRYGATPSYDGETPTKDGDGKRFYTFKGWYPEIEENSVDGDKEYVAQYNMSIAVDENDEPLEITTDETAVTTTVQIAGKLNVAPAATLTTEDLILEGTPNSSGEIIIGGTVTATRAYFDFSNGTEGFKARTWYAVAVPWQVDVPAYDKEHNGVYIKTDEGDFVQQELGQTFDLIYYDGALRASQGVNKAWNYVEDDQLEHSKHYVMMPGRAYMIYLTADAQTIRFERKEGADLLTNTLAVETYDLGTGNGKDANWNGIANPATYHAYINASVKNYTTDVMNVGQVYDAKTKKYSVVNMSTQSLVVGQPIFVQATESNASVVAYADKNDAFHAPRRAAKAAASLTRYELYLAPSMDIATDQIVVRMNEGKEDDVYTVGQDLVKMGVSDLVPQMWIERYDSKMCINTVAPVDNTADYPLGIFVPKNGEYDIFLDDEPDSKSTLYLTYDGEAIWNLSNGAYVANLEKGTNTHYGLRICAKSPQIATGIDEAVVDAQGETRKVMINETVYIIRGGKVYSAEGQLVK